LRNHVVWLRWRPARYSGGSGQGKLSARTPNNPFPSSAVPLKGAPSLDAETFKEGKGSPGPPGKEGLMAVETKPLMPKATAVWLIDNTSLTFEQIADFCGLHPLEVKGIADEDVAKGIKGQDPVASGQLTREQIEDAEKDSAKRL